MASEFAKTNPSLSLSYPGIYLSVACVLAQERLYRGKGKRKAQERENVKTSGAPKRSPVRSAWHAVAYIAAFDAFIRRCTHRSLLTSSTGKIPCFLVLQEPIFRGEPCPILLFRTFQIDARHIMRNQTMTATSILHRNT